MQKGSIGVTTENIFPIIKKFLYSDHEIFLRELIANAVDAVQKLKTVASNGEFNGELGDLTIRVSLEKDKLTISDRGVGMTAEEVDKYLNQIAFSSADEFIKKYKNQSIIGHFGLGFYSAFMVSKKVEVVTLSYTEGAKAVRWSCDGSPEYTLEETEKASRGTDIILHIDDDSKEFLEEARINELLRKYCRYLPVEIAFGKEKEWKDGKQTDTDKDHIINEVNPAWTRKPADMKDEDYMAFYSDLYPMQEPPMFYIHLNVDYPFHLTGILYFPKIKSNIEFRKNRIQLYCNQVFVTDSVEGIVPDFLTLLHGVLDSPDIPLNVSRSYLQSDSGVKKISGHITKKVADRLEEIFKKDRTEFEQKWDNLKLFIEYGVVTDEKFAERADKFLLYKNTDNKYFTFEEYEKIIKSEQTDRDKKTVILYTTDIDAQYTFIEAAKAKGYDVLNLDGQLDIHFINHLESKKGDFRFARVDADVIDNLIRKDDELPTTLPQEQQNDLRDLLEDLLPRNSGHFFVTCQNTGEQAVPMLITQSEFMRRMKDMSAMGGENMGFYGAMPDSYNLVINADHALVKKLISEKDADIGEELKKLDNELTPVESELKSFNESLKDKKEEEIEQAQKDRRSELQQQEDAIRNCRKEALKAYGKQHSLPKQLVDLALLANNMLKGEDLNKFIHRSVEMIE
ncbi:MAG: molecular chaperone HtpG [Bacteroidales bacterium]|jgi:molecular chaperone HtpG|nr:molecular chaperone HtpG [Bacteroidales bacterium]